MNPLFKNLFPDLKRTTRPAYYADGKTPKGRTGEKGEKKKTKRGATHVLGASFRPVKVMRFVGAEYRRKHLERLSIAKARRNGH